MAADLQGLTLSQRWDHLKERAMAYTTYMGVPPERTPESVGMAIESLDIRDKDGNPKSPMKGREFTAEEMDKIILWFDAYIILSDFTYPEDVTL